MILIISDINDESTNDLVDLLILNNEEFYLIRNGVDKIKLIYCTSEEFSIMVNDRDIIESEKLKSIYFRRDVLRVKAYEQLDEENIELQAYYHSENLAVSEFLNYCISKDKRCVGNPFRTRVNKLIVLKLAEKIGLRVPEYLITTSKTQLKSFYDKYKSVITKSINTQMFFKLNNENPIALYTSDVDSVFIDNLSETFSSSFFQQKVEKLYDIRGFYFNGSIFSIAILSQQNEKTKTDFRKYDRVKPNRKLEFELPDNLKEKIIKLHQLLQLNCSSFDIIYGIDNNYYFLETNPVGQHHMVAAPLGIDINKLIFNELKR